MTDTVDQIAIIHLNDYPIDETEVWWSNGECGTQLGF
jgi:hypothetical protein